MSQVLVYACGGAGINICKDFYFPEESREPGFASLRTVMIDTSTSNVPKSIIGTKHFIHTKDITGNLAKGSGKIRSENYESINVQLDELIKSTKPGDINIIVHSTSGGTGSTVGNMLASSLLGQGRDVIVLMVGSSSCRQEILNSLSTLKSYQAIAQKRNRPVIAYYLSNDHHPMQEVDNSIRLLISMILMTWSDQNHGLDQQDLTNFLNYDRVSPYTPALVGLDTLVGDIPLTEPTQGQAISSFLTIVRENEDPTPPFTVGYHCYGYMSQEASESLKIETPIRMTTVQGYFTPIVNDLSNTLSKLDTRIAENTISQVTIAQNESGEDGIIL